MYEIPDGQACGLLPRAFKFGEVCGALEDNIDIIPREKWGKYIDNGAPDFREYIKHILYQGGIGSCATESATQGAAAMECFRTGKYTIYNPWTVYPFVTVLDDGSSLDVVLKRLRTHGVLPESIWPRKGPKAHPWNEKPPQELFDKYGLRVDEAYDIASIDQLGTASIMGFTVCYGWKPSRRTAHAELITKIRSKVTAEDCNSYGLKFGDKGFGVRPLSQVDFRFGAFAIRTVINMADEE